MQSFKSRDLKSKMLSGDYGSTIKFICQYNQDRIDLENSLRNGYEEINNKFNKLKEIVCIKLKSASNKSNSPSKSTSTMDHKQKTLSGPNEAIINSKYP
jgi:hypothetical protein